MNVNILQVRGSERANDNAQVATSASARVDDNKALRLFIGTVNNKNEPLTTIELTEKIKSARVAGAIAMALGITLCIVATVLVAGIGLPLIPIAPIFALGLAACLFGFVITAVTTKPLNNINDTPATEVIYSNPAFNDRDRISIEAPSLETTEGAAAPAEKAAFTDWLIRYGLNTNPNFIDKEEIKALGYNQILRLEEYDLSDMHTLFHPLIAGQIKSLIESITTPKAEKEKLVEFAKYYLDSISENTLALYSYNIKEAYKLLSPHLGIQTMPRFTRGRCEEKNEPVKILPNYIKKYSELRNELRFERFAGAHRDVYINKRTGDGYKVIRRVRNRFETSLDDDALRNSDDLRLNAIYKSDQFYGGRYRDYACFQLIEIEDDYRNGMIEVLMFQKIPGALPLTLNEKIPHSAVRMLESMGYFPYDMIPGNFVKVFNPDTNQHDYLPVDAKFIGYKKSSSIRTRDIKRYKKTTQLPYQCMPNIAFTK